MLVDSSSDTGVTIDRHGQLNITSARHASRRHETALIVSSVSTNFVRSDFTRLLPSPAEIENAKDSLMKQALNVLRDHEHPQYLFAVAIRDIDFGRLPHWILRFERPYLAALYQHRLRWYHANARLNLPVDPYAVAITNNRELRPPDDYVDPVSSENTWKRLHEFSLLLREQDFTVTAMLAPLPETVLSALWNHRHWNFLDGPYKVWPLRIWVHDTDLTGHMVEAFLSEADKSANKKWDVIQGVGRLEALYGSALSARGKRRDERGSGIEAHRNWVLRFRSEENALLFWRTWHRQPFPQSLLRPYDGRAGLLHVDPLW